MLLIRLLGVVRAVAAEVEGVAIGAAGEVLDGVGEHGSGAGKRTGERDLLDRVEAAERGPADKRAYENKEGEE